MLHTDVAITIITHPILQIFISYICVLITSAISSIQPVSSTTCLFSAALNEVFFCGLYVIAPIFRSFFLDTEIFCKAVNYAATNSANINVTFIFVYHTHNSLYDFWIKSTWPASICEEVTCKNSFIL